MARPVAQPSAGESIRRRGPTSLRRPDQGSLWLAAAGGPPAPRVSPTRRATLNARARSDSPLRSWTTEARSWVRSRGATKHRCRVSVEFAGTTSLRSHQQDASRRPTNGVLPQRPQDRRPSPSCSQPRSILDKRGTVPVTPRCPRPGRELASTELTLSSFLQRGVRHTRWFTMGILGVDAGDSGVGDRAGCGHRR
jgi:hypothetical protein